MTNKKRARGRIMALLLAVSLLFSVASIPVFAEGAAEELPGTTQEAQAPGDEGQENGENPEGTAPSDDGEGQPSASIDPDELEDEDNTGANAATGPADEPDESGPANRAPTATPTTLGYSSITAFAPLPEDVAEQEVTTGTPLADLDLPDTLAATVEDEDGNQERGDIPVEGWRAAPEYDPQAMGAYTFAPKLAAGYTLANGVALPEITVRVVMGISPTALTDYHSGDVSVINAIITDNGLTGYSEDQPENWGFVTWSSSTPYRVEQLDLINRGLTGTLDVSGLANLKTLACTYNSLTGLNVSGLANLTLLNCQYNGLTELDVSDNSALTSLYCRNNPLRQFVLSDGSEINISITGSGSVMFTASENIQLSGSRLTYTANGWQFERWESDDSAINGTTDSILTFPKPSGGTVSITAVFGTNSTNYNAEDIAVVNRIIEEQGLSLDKWVTSSEPPMSWTNHILWSSASTDRRITAIYLNNQGLTGQLDLSGLSALKILSCNNNSNLTGLDVSGCTALTSLYCHSSGLESLAASGCIALETLDCSFNNLTTLDVSGCVALTTLNCSGHNLTTLDVSGCTALTTLNCSSNNLGTLDVSDCTALTTLNCSSNNLDALDVSENTALTTLDCSSNPLFGLNMPQSTVLDVSGCTKLETLNCSNNRLPFLNVSHNPLLTTLDCSNSDRINTLDVSHNPLLTTLDCSSSIYLARLDVSKNPLLTTLNCSSSPRINTLDVSKNPLLTTLNCDNITLLRTLDVSGLANLEILNCYSSNLRTLDVSGCTALETLHCNGNRFLTMLDVSDCVALTTLHCYSNELNALDVSKNPLLTTLNCSSNSLTTLDVSKNPLLTTLNCSSNSLTMLDVSGNAALTTLYCSSNPLRQFALTNGSKINVTVIGGGIVQLTTTSNIQSSGTLAFTATGSFIEWQSDDVSVGSPTNTSLTFPKPSGGDVVNITAVFEAFGGCNVDDIAVINKIIDDNPGISLERWDSDGLPPTSWNGRIGWSTVSTDKRITTIKLNGFGLTGRLDVSGLSELTELTCYNNNLTELDVSEVPVGSSTTVYGLECDNNPIQYLKLANGNSLQVNIDPVYGGAVMLTGYAHPPRRATLTATPDGPYVFIGWTGDHIDTADSVYFPITGDMTVTANFRITGDAQAPNITNQPQGGAYTLNAPAILTVAADASDSGALSYQWYSNANDNNSGGNVISGATASSYAPPTNTVGTTYYYVVVTNTNPYVTGSKTATTISNTAAVTVNALTNAQVPSIDIQPVGGTYTLNATATLNVTASVSDGGTLSYQWYRNVANNTTGGTAVGGNSSSYTPSTDTVGTTYYYVVVTNTNSSATGHKTATTISNTAAVVVNAGGGNPDPSPTLTLGGIDTDTVTIGTYYNITVSTTYTGNRTLAYSISSGSLPDGMTLNTATGSISGTPKPATEGDYPFTITVEEQSGTLRDSRSFSLTVQSAPVVLDPVVLRIAKPLNDSIHAGYQYSKTFSVTYTGSEMLEYDAQGLPANLSINAATGEIIGVPAVVGGPYTITITVREAGGSNPLSASTTYELTVTARDSGNNGNNNNGGNSNSGSGGGSSGGGSSTPDGQRGKTQLPASAFSWDGGRTLTIDHDSVTALGLLSVQWNGQTLTPGADFTTHQGSVIIRFSEDFIAAQATGDHTVRVEFLNHYGETTVKLTADTGTTDADPQNPNTGGDTHNPQTGDFDNSPWWWLVALIPAAALTLFAAAQLWRRLRRTEG